MGLQLDSRRLVLWLALCPALLGPAVARGADEEPAPLFPFVLPWNDAAPGVTNLAAWLDSPAGKDGPVVVRDGHLFTGSKRIRFFGVNLCFGANFPTHAAAEQVAARMAKFGINAVRFHHMDMQSTPGGIFAADGRTLDPGQLDRLDYLFAQLKAQGIYADLNLHVSRSYPGMPRWEGMPDFFKGVDQFVPRMIEWQRQYARDLLTHFNPYTRTRYADEPAVAIIEINNENALTQDWSGGRLDDMPPLYADELARQWNAWLAAKYPSFDDLKRAWGASATARGRERLLNPEFAKGLEGWFLEQHGTAKADARPESGAIGVDFRPDDRSQLAVEVRQVRPAALRVEVRQVDGETWHVQLTQGKQEFQADKPYTLRFRAKADAPRRLAVNAMQAHDPWRILWSSDVRLTTEWQTFQFTFAPASGDPNARITFGNLGERTGSVWLADVSLKPGGVLGLRDGEGAGHVGIFPKRDFSSRTPEAQRDWVRFLWETEERYWTGMARYLRDDLKARALIVGTQMGWSPFPIQAKLDVIDSHSYWQHPHFPGRPWDMDNWTVKNVPMTAAPDGGTLPRLGLSRVAGKPFICTEYNHSAPNTYASEAFLLIAAYAAQQDWDGVFAFAYSHRGNDWDTKRIPSFFDIDQHPTKMATLPAAVAMFVRGDVPAPACRLTARLTLAQAIERVRQAGPYLGADAFGINRADALRVPVGLALADTAAPEALKAQASDSALVWHPEGSPGLVVVNAPRSRALVGSMDEGKTYRLGDVDVIAGPTRQHWAAISLTALDGPDLRSPGRILITATGLAENTAMGWKNAEKSTVGRDWGRAPSLVEGIPATIVLPVAEGRVRVWALDERGQRKAQVPVRKGGKAAIAIGPALRTIWYEVEVAP